MVSTVPTIGNWAIRIKGKQNKAKGRRQNFPLHPSAFLLHPFPTPPMLKTSIITATLLTGIVSPAQAFTFSPVDSTGNVRRYESEPYLYISSGRQARSIASLNAFLGFQMPYGNGGSAAIFDLEPGRYQMRWRLQTNLNEYSDELFLWNGALTSLASSSEAHLPHEYGGDRITTEWHTTEFESFGRIILIALDGQRHYDTTLKIDNISAVPEPSTVGGLIVAGFALIRRGRVAR